MTQLDEYPLGLLQSPNEQADPIGHRCWNGNDRMILGFMQSQMYAAEIQYIASCTTSAEAFRTLRTHHEKRSGLTQLQLIQNLMQITFDDDPTHFDNNITTFRDLVYRIESIGHVDVHRLGLLFLLLNLKSSHPTVHDALAVALMDGSISVELMENRMQYYFEMHGAQQGQQHMSGSSITLPAQLPLRTVMCPNCKRPGHSIEFCIAPGGKMEGLSMQDAIDRQCVVRDNMRQHVKPREETNAPSNGTLLKLDNDGSVWIASICYRPDSKISAALANSEHPILDPDLDKYSDWPAGSSADMVLDTSAILIASINSTNVALLSHPTNIPFFLDSGASSHISCVCSDFVTLKQLDEPRKISGVGNASGPHAIMSHSSFHYIMNLIDDYSGYNWTHLLKAKSDAFGAFCTWLTATEIQSGKKLCYVLTDNGELRSTDMAHWCADCGITHQFTAPHTSAQNGRVERLHRTLMDKARTMCLACDAPLQMWDEFIVTTSYLTNLTASRTLNGHTPHKLWFNAKPSISHLREIGCRAYVLISRNNPKIAARSLECILIGYTPNSKAYRCWDRQGSHVIGSHHVHFIEHLQGSSHTLTPGVIINPLEDTADHNAPSFPSFAAPPPPLPSPLILSPPTHPPSTSPLPLCCSARRHIPAPTQQETCDGLEPKKGVTADLIQAVLALAKEKHEDDVSTASAHQSGEDSCHTRSETAMFVDVEDPDLPTWGQAIASSEQGKWLEGAQEEIHSLEDMEVFQLVPRLAVPSGRKILRGKFICKLKHDKLGNPTRYKVRWVAKGFQQVWGRDYTNTTSPTTCLASMHTILHIATCNDWRTDQYDVKTAFLNGILSEKEVQFMEQPPSFAAPGSESHVW